MHQCIANHEIHQRGRNPQFFVAQEGEVVTHQPFQEAFDFGFLIVIDGKVSLIAGVTADATGKVKAGELVNFVAKQVGGKGGGRADMAQAGGTEPAGLEQALAGVVAWVAERA